MSDWDLKVDEPAMEKHVLPIDDLREHVESSECWCQPTVWQGPMFVMFTHNSADGRELVERHGVN